jgi:hypothetical protein
MCRTCPSLTTRLLTASGVLAISPKYLLTGASALRDRNGVLELCGIEGDESFPISIHRLVLCAEDRFGPSEQSSMLLHSTTGHIARGHGVWDDAEASPITPQGQQTQNVIYV